MDERILAVILAALAVMVAASSLITLGNGGVVFIKDTAPLAVNDKGAIHA